MYLKLSLFMISPYGETPCSVNVMLLRTCLERIASPFRNYLNDVGISVVSLFSQKVQIAKTTTTHTIFSLYFVIIRQFTFLIKLYFISRL